jgi:hypothetical protein
VTASRPALARLDARLTLVELRAAVLDGDLIRLGPGFLCLDEPEGPSERAASLAAELGDARAIVCDRSAAWVWGWAHSSAALQTCVSISARVASPVRRRLRTREAVIDDSEVAQLDGVRVTTPLRTAIDLVRHDADDHVIDIVVDSLRRGDLTAEALRAELQRRSGVAHHRRARVRIDQAISRC